MIKRVLQMIGIWAVCFALVAALLPAQAGYANGAKREGAPGGAEYREWDTFFEPGWIEELKMRYHPARNEKEVSIASAQAGKGAVPPAESKAGAESQLREAAEAEGRADNRQDGRSENDAAEGAVAQSSDTVLRYEVVAGDTMYRIAKNFGLTAAELIAANPSVDPNKLRIGQMIDIPNLKIEGIAGASGFRPLIKKVLVSTLTAYTAGPESTGKTPSHPAYGITKSGSKAEEGRTIAVDPNLIPLGSLVLIEGIGIRRAEDTGSAIKGPRIDVFMNDLEEALKFGVKKNVKVYVLEQPDHAV